MLKTVLFSKKIYCEECIRCHLTQDQCQRVMALLKPTTKFGQLNDLTQTSKCPTYS